MIVLPRERTPRKRWNCRWPYCPKFAQLRKRLFCTLHYQLYLCGQDNNAAESLASIHNNSGNNEPRDVSAVGNIGGDHVINNNNPDVAFVNNAGDTKRNHDSCGTGPDVHVDNWLGVGDVVGDNDNGSLSPGGDNGFEVGRLNNIKPHEFAAVGNVGGGPAININHFDVAVVNNVGNTEFINNSCGTGPDINVGDQMGVVDVVAALNSDLHDVAILQQQRTSFHNNQNLLVIPPLIMKTRNKEEMTVLTMQLDKQEKTLTLAVELRQGLALATLLDTPTTATSSQRASRELPESL
jgi:hypothetical protein